MTFHGILQDAKNAQQTLTNSNSSFGNKTELRVEKLNANSDSVATYLNNFGQAIRACLSCVEITLQPWLV